MLWSTAAPASPLRLDLIEARSFDCGVVVHIYRPRAGS